MNRRVYEVLVLLRTGEPVTAYPAPHGWKRGEREPIFRVVQMTATKKELSELLAGVYQYDPTAATQFRHVETGTDYDPRLALDKTDAPTHQAGLSETVADQCDTDWRKKEPDVCRFLHPPHLSWPANGDFSAIRKYWFRKLRRHKTAEGMRPYLAAVLFRDYGNIAEVGRLLPPATKRELMASFYLTNEDKRWMAWTWREPHATIENAQ